MKRACKYPFRSAFYSMGDIFDDAEIYHGGIYVKDILYPLQRHYCMDEEIKHIIEIVKLSIRKHPDLYRPSLNPYLNWKDMTINIDNY